MSQLEYVKRPTLTDATVHPEPILNEILTSRGVFREGDLDLSLKKMLSPYLLKDMDKAVHTLERHLNNRNGIIIVGDFDCDGATSTAIMMESLKSMGAGRIDYIVPDRRIHGYGLSPEIADLAMASKPGLVITVDNGINSFKGAERIYELGGELLITDHHLPDPEGTPKSEAIINPNQVGCEFPSKSLAGCGTAFYVMVALRSHLSQTGYFKRMNIDGPDLRPLLDLVSLGTVADVVSLDLNNRILVEAGLERVRKGLVRPGIQDIFNQKNKELKNARSSDWGFVVGPVLNAAGRLDNMKLGIEALLSQSANNPTIPYIIDLNEERKAITAKMVEEADNILVNPEQEWGITLYNPDWHEGVVGILASRVKEAENRPVICMTATHEAKQILQEIDAVKDGGASNDDIERLNEELGKSLVKGSARSIKGVHLKHILIDIANEHPKLMNIENANNTTKFGGHAMAAGISIEYRNLDKFRKVFDLACEKAIKPEMIDNKVIVDQIRPPKSLYTMAFAEQLSRLGPWGADFERPVFYDQFIIHSFKPVGNGKTITFELRPLNGGDIISAIQFNALNEDGVPPFKCGTFLCAAFELDINEFRGNRKLQLVVSHSHCESFAPNITSTIDNSQPKVDSALK
ncbi:DHH family phosphoesterase [Vibrio splendidus]